MLLNNTDINNKGNKSLIFYLLDKIVLLMKIKIFVPIYKIINKVYNFSNELPHLYIYHTIICSERSTNK